MPAAWLERGDGERDIGQPSGFGTCQFSVFNQLFPMGSGVSGVLWDTGS